MCVCVCVHARLYCTTPNTCSYSSHTSWFIHHSIVRLVAGRILQVTAILLAASSPWLGHRRPPTCTRVLSPAVTTTVFSLSATLGHQHWGCCFPTIASCSGSNTSTSSARVASIRASNRYSWTSSVVPASTTSWFPGHLDTTLRLLVSCFDIQSVYLIALSKLIESCNKYCWALETI